MELCGICGSDLHAAQLPRSTSATASWDTNRPGGLSPSAPTSRIGAWVNESRINPNGNVCGVSNLQIGAANFWSGHPRNGTGVASQRRTRAADGSNSPACGPSHQKCPHGTGPRSTPPRPPARRGRGRRFADKDLLVTGGGFIGQLASRLANLEAPRRVLLWSPPPIGAFAPKSHATVITAEEAADANVTVMWRSNVGRSIGYGVRDDSARTARHPRRSRLGAGTGLDAATILLKEIAVRGSYTYTDEFDRAIDLLATGLFVVDVLTSVVTPLPDTLAAFEELRASRMMKALIAPN